MFREHLLIVELNCRYYVLFIMLNFFVVCKLFNCCFHLYIHKTYAPSEARTHDLQIMRLTRCLLRHRGLSMIDNVTI